MKVRIIYDSDGTHEKNLEGFRISTQMFHNSNGQALVKVFDEHGKMTHVYHVAKVYIIEHEL